MRGGPAAAGGVIAGVYCPHTPTLLERGMHPATERALRGLAPLLEGVDALVVASPHWVARDAFLVQAAARPRCIQDYYGFPPSAYAIRYEPSGDPELAGAIAAEASRSGLAARATEAWGLDHGHWVPLVFLRPDGLLPVVGLSVGAGSPADHRRVGAAAARAAKALDRRVVVIGTGSLSHRLDRITWGQHHPEPEGEEFDRRVIAALEEGRPGDIEGLDRRLWEAAAPEGDLGPLQVVLGALGVREVRAELLAYERFFTGVSLATLLFRPGRGVQAEWMGVLPGRGPVAGLGWEVRARERVDSPWAWWYTVSRAAASGKGAHSQAFCPAQGPARHDPRGFFLFHAIARI